MLRRLKKLQILLALIISLSIPIYSGFLLFCDLAEDDPFSTDAKYENADIDDSFLVSNFQNQLKSFGSIGPNVLSPVLLPEIKAIEQVTPLTPLLSCLIEETFVLRC